MGTSDSYVYQGGPSTSAKKHKSLTVADPGWERKVAEFADAGIKSMREPKQPPRRATRIEPIADQVADRAVDVADRLVAAAARHRPTSDEPAEIDRALKSIIDEVFDGEYGTGRIESLVRRCAVEAAARWLRHEVLVGPGETEPEEPVEVEEILVDPLSVVAPELVESAEPLEQLVDEFLVELLVELIQVVGGETMFPGLSALKLLWALYRWGVARLLESRRWSRGISRERGRSVIARTEREVVDDLFGLGGRAERPAAVVESEGVGNG